MVLNRGAAPVPLPTIPGSEFESRVPRSIRRYDLLTLRRFLRHDIRLLFNMVCTSMARFSTSSASSACRTKKDAIANPMATRLTIDQISRVAWTRRMGL